MAQRMPLELYDMWSGYQTRGWPVDPQKMRDGRVPMLLTFFANVRDVGTCCNIF